MYIEIKHLKTLVVLRETGSLATAAERLFLTQSALSHQLKALESQLGCALFERKTKPVIFSPAGERLLTLAERVLPEIKQALSDLEGINRGQIGRLHIAVECYNCFSWLSPLLETYRHDWAEVDLDFSISHGFDPLQALLEQQLDLVITSDPQPISGLHYQTLFDYEMRLLVSPLHPLAEKTTILPEDFLHETLITFPVERQRLSIFNYFLQPANIEPANIRHCEVIPMMLQLAASQRGVCVLPDWILSEVTANISVVEKRLGVSGLFCRLYAATRSEDQEKPYLKAFMELLPSE